MDDKVSDEDFQAQMNQFKSWGDAIKFQEKVFENLTKSEYSVFDHKMAEDAEQAAADFANDWTVESINSKIADWAGKITVYVAEKHDEYESEYHEMCENAAGHIAEILEPISDATLIDIEAEMGYINELSESLNQTRDVITGLMTELDTAFETKSAELSEKLEDYVTIHEVNEYEAGLPEISNYLTTELYDEKVAEIHALFATFATIGYDFEAELQSQLREQHETVSAAAAGLESTISDWREEITQMIDDNNQTLLNYKESHDRYNGNQGAMMENIESTKDRLIGTANRTLVHEFDELLQIVRTKCVTSYGSNVIR